MVEAAGLAHSIIVHPEPYQDDHRYLEYCFAHEPRPGYFNVFAKIRPTWRRLSVCRVGAHADAWFPVTQE